MKRTLVISGSVGILVVIYWLVAYSGATGQTGLREISYPIPETVKNIYIRAASRWPSLEEKDIEGLIRPLSEKERQSVKGWVSATVASKWLTPEFPEDGVCLAEWGVVSMRQTEDYKVRVRAAKIPYQVGNRQGYHGAILLAVEPIDEGNAFTIPANAQEFDQILSKFLGPAIPEMSSQENEIHFGCDDSAAWLARIPSRRPGGFPTIVYAWLNQRVLLCGIKKDIMEHLGVGPVPERYSGDETPPPPGDEPIEFHGGELTPEELENEAN